MTLRKDEGQGWPSSKQTVTEAGTDGETTANDLASTTSSAKSGASEMTTVRLEQTDCTRLDSTRNGSEFGAR
jgi:hypothetical protein